MNEIRESEIKKLLYLLIAFTAIIRLITAFTLELSVDEVYYWTYALYPDWSHFDHPPMVGLVIQLFSLNLFFESELAIRLGAVCFSVINTLIIYSIGKEIKNPITGLYAAFLLNASIYASVLAGNFIIPDTPQLLFWLISLKYLLKALPGDANERRISIQFLIACFFVGLSILSKYHGVFIWAGIALYVILYNRTWLQKPVFYLGGLISALFILPIAIWNFQNNWISFNFHGERVSNDLGFRADYFFTEIFGQVAYNNPINYVLIVLAIIALVKGKLSVNSEYKKILLLNSIPIWLVFTSFSLFRSTLPHWTGPAFTPLMILAAVFVHDRTTSRQTSKNAVFFPAVLRSSIILLYTLLLAAILLIQLYPGTIGKTDKISKYGDTDFTLDMYGWRQINLGFQEIVKRDVSEGKMPLDAAIISPKYFPGTEIDYYVARPIGKKVLQYGSLPNIHKYAWINETRGQLMKGEDAYMISTSNWYKDPFEYYADNFSQIIASDTIEVSRSGRLAYYAFVYQLIDYKGNFPDPFVN